MTAILIGLAIGVLMGTAYLFSREPTARRTLASSVLLGVVVGILVELARRPLFAVLFAAIATTFGAEFIRWVRRSRNPRIHEQHMRS